MRRDFLVVFVVLCCASSVLSAADEDDLRLTLPPTGYAVVGETMTVYLNNIVLAENDEGLGLEVQTNIGSSTVDSKNGRLFWTFTPSEPGLKRCEIRVSRGNDVAAKQSMNWHVSPGKVSADREIKLLIVGDSLTHHTIYPNDLAKRLTESGVQWKMFGTHRPPNAAPGVAHEGYGGWRWETFVTHYDPNPDPDKTKRKHSSPFVFLENDKRKLDVPRFIREFCENQPPDFVIVKLGINDCFGANPNDIEKMDQHIDGVFQHAETLIKALREAAPKAELGICLTTPGNMRDGAFKANYEDRYPRWGWKRIQHRLVERQLKQFNGRETDRIRVIPTELNLDPDAGYPTDNAVHPNEVGYRQIAASIHAWLMSRLTSP